MDRVKHLLQQANVAQYLDKFQATGYDSLADILSMGEEDLKQMGEHTGMLPGHLTRLCRVITSIRSSVPTPKPVEQSIEGSVSSATNNFSKRKRPPELQNCYATKKEVKLASLQHSCSQGCSCMIDVKKSGSKAKIYRCRSVLSKRLKKKREDEDEDEDEDDPRPACQYRLHWALKKGEWVLMTKKSHLKHMPFCTSGQHVTRFELVNDASFVKHCNVTKNVTGKGGAEEALGGSTGRVAGSVKTHTAKRAVNDIKHFWIHDYDHDWNKLHGWGRDYQKKTPRGKFHIKTDDENR